MYQSSALDEENEPLFVENQVVDSSDAELKLETEVDHRGKRRTTLIAAALILCSVSATILCAGYGSFGGVQNALRLDSADSISIDNLDDTCDLMSVVATNEYGQFSAPYPYLINGAILIEPYKETTLTVSIPSDLSVQDLGLTFEWVLGDSPSNMYGSAVTTTIYTTGYLEYTVHVSDSSSNALCSYKGKAYVKYVKRELRALTAGDRDAVLDAVATLWQYSQEDGEAKFGSDYLAIQTLVEAHASASNDIMCDQFHDGSGFLTHHLALGLAFESSVRAVNPSVTMPYWDFTIEGEIIFQNKGTPSDLYDLGPFFSSEWFGSVDESHHIADGRWAHSEIPVATMGVDQLTRNSFGLVRSYWNNNADKEISRSLSKVCGIEPKRKDIPHCSTHLAVLNSMDLPIFQSNAPSDGHGPMHVNLGGAWGGCEEDYAALAEKWADVLDANVTEDEVRLTGHDVNEFYNKWGLHGQRRQIVETSIVGEIYTIYRSLWRSHVCAADKQPGYLQCPESCTEAQADDCRCQVSALITGDTDATNLRGCMVTKDNVEFVDALLPDELMADLTKFVGTTDMVEGDMVESASTADPLFWFIHPVLERLLQAKRNPAVLTMGSSSFYKWAPTSGNDQTFLEFSIYSFGEGEMAWHPEAYTCPGHAAADPVLPESLHLTSIFYENGADADGDGVISNWEFYLALDPSKPSMNDYVFADFSWEHCT